MPIIIFQIFQTLWRYDFYFSDMKNERTFADSIFKEILNAETMQRNDKNRGRRGIPFFRRGSILSYV